MDDARKKLRVCLICVVAVAVIIGVIYYVNEMKAQNNVSEGTLVRTKTGIDHVCKEAFENKTFENKTFENKTCENKTNTENMWEGRG